MILTIFGAMSTNLSGVNDKTMLGPREVPSVSTYSYVLPSYIVGTLPNGVGNEIIQFGPREYPTTVFTYSLPSGVQPAALPTVAGKRFVETGYTRPNQEGPAGVPNYVS